jgi:hypothetical protein
MKNLSFEERISHYENNGQTDAEFLGGHTDKKFVRLDDDKMLLKKKRKVFLNNVKKSFKDSHFFGELFKQLQTKKSSYVTYLNDLVAPKDGSEPYIPQYVSCLIKELTDQILFYSECISCRIANAIGVKTVFNTAHEMPRAPWESKDDPVRYDYLISVDYVPTGYRTENLLELGIYFNVDTTLPEIFKNIDKKLQMIADMEKIKLTEENVARFKRDFVKQFLFRQFICEDFDFESKNMGLLIGENGDFELAPCFDMEYAMYGKKTPHYYQSFAKGSIKYLYDCMPDVLEEFVNDCRNAYNSGKIAKIFDKTCPRAERREIEKIKKQTLNNFETFISLYNEHVSNNAKSSAI